VVRNRRVTKRGAMDRVSNDLVVSDQTLSDRYKITRRVSADPSALAVLLVGQIRPVFFLLVPSQLGASTVSPDRFILRRTLRRRG